MKIRFARCTTALLIGAVSTAGLPIANAQSAKADANASKPAVTTPPATGSTAALPPEQVRIKVETAATSATPAIPATPEIPAAPAKSATAAVPATPAASAAPAISDVVSPPADPSSLPTGRATASVAAALDAMKLAPALRSATISTRDQVIADLETQIAAAEKAMSSFGKTTAEMNAEGQKKFKAASDDVKEKAKALKKSVQTARKASDPEWDNARSQLSADYEAYASALASVDAAAGIAPTTR